MGTDQRRAILAVVVSGIILFGWQYFFAPPVNNAPVTKTVSTSTEATDNLESTKDNSISSSNSVKPVVSIDNTTLEVFTLKNSQYEYSFNNYLTLIDVISNADKSFSSVFTSKNNNQLLFLINGDYKNVFFTITKKTDSEATLLNNELGINGSVRVDEKGFLHFNLNSTEAFSYKFLLTEKTEELEGGKVKQFLFLADDLLDIKLATALR